MLLLLLGVVGELPGEDMAGDLGELLETVACLKHYAKHIFRFLAVKSSKPKQKYNKYHTTLPVVCRH